tara:strand:- start:2075 stop:3193 length:1119 start_codon:yes stop_codon:yes gene_type:complete
MNTYFIILAAGKSKRFKSKLPKQFNFFNGKRLFQHSIDKAERSNLFKKIILVINKSHKKYLNKLQKKNLIIINGGSDRSNSSNKALNFLKKYKPTKVFIHDAARPNFSINLLKRLSRQIKKEKAVVPYIKSEDSVKIKTGKIFKNLDRNKLYLTQTPQCFDYKLLLKYSNSNKLLITDDVSILINNNIKVKFISGEKENFKITQYSDLKKQNFNTYYGIGFDIHRLEKGTKLYLGGIKIPYHSGLKGHSDGDVIIHALIDGLLGASKLKDIGTLFSNKNAKYKNIRSPKMLKKILNLIKVKNYLINNIDINVIAEQPKVSKYRKKIIKSISNLCDIKMDQINLKGKTAEKIGLIGKQKAIACEVITSLNKYE